jgi:hypothetical protein
MSRVESLPSGRASVVTAGQDAASQAHPLRADEPDFHTAAVDHAAALTSGAAVRPWAGSRPEKIYVLGTRHTRPRRLTFFWSRTKQH